MLKNIVQSVSRENTSNSTGKSSEKTRVLIFTDWFLPGYKAGGPVTSLANLTAHLKKDIDFFIVTRDTDYCEREPYKNIETDQWTKAAENTWVFYLSKTSLSQKSILKAIKNHAFDSWYINGIYSWYFSILPLILARKIHKGKVIISPRGMLSPHAININPLKKKTFLFLAKMAGLYKNVIFNTTNRREKDDVKERLPGNKIVIAPNLSRPLKKEIRKSVKKESGELRLLSLARIAPEKNTLGALKILSSFGHSLNNNEYRIDFDLYGHLYNQKYWKDCLEIVNKMPTQIRVNYHGSASPDLIPSLLEKTHFLFLPTHGENFGHAIQEALSNATPVIISDQTPWRKLEEKNAGWDLSLKDPQKFQEILKKCLEMNPSQYAKMSSSSYLLAKEKIADDQILSIFRELFT